MTTDIFKNKSLNVNLFLVKDKRIKSIARDNKNKAIPAYILTENTKIVKKYLKTMSWKKIEIGLTGPDNFNCINLLPSVLDPVARE